MQCLNCCNEMTNYEVTTLHSSISYNVCEKCGGLWLDAGDLKKMAFQVQGDIEFCSQEKTAEAEKRTKKCPRCDNFNLDQVKFIGCDDILLHHCRNCGGFWLDGGELNLIDEELTKIMPVRGKGFSDFVNNVHVPYWFKRIQRKSGEADFHVDVPPIEGASLEGATSDACPACGSGQTLNSYKLSGMPFQGCEKCRGVWLMKDELRKLKNRVEEGSLRWMNDEIENIEKASAIRTERICVHCKTARMVCVLFGKSSLMIDWCPQCHGIWLDGGEFDSMTAYLKDEELKMSSGEIEKEVVQDIERTAKGGPENRLDEIRDAKAALSAMVNTTIFEHPRLFKLLTSAADTAHLFG